MDIRQFLGGIPFFAQTLDADHLDALAAGARLVTFAPGAGAILEDDETAGAMYVVVAGTFVVTVADGTRVRQVATLGEGQIFGEMSLLTGLPRIARVTAGDGAEAVEITMATLRPILVDSPQLYDRLAGMLQKRQGDLDQIVDPGFWESHGRSRESLARAMRRHFEETG